MYEITSESLLGVQQKIKPKVLVDEDLKPLREDEEQWQYLAPSAFNSCQFLPRCLRRSAANSVCLPSLEPTNPSSGIFPLCGPNVTLTFKSAPLEISNLVISSLTAM